MKVKRVIMKSVTIITVLSMLLTGCGKEDPLPETTGEELGVYYLDGKFVNANAEEFLENGTPVYRLNEDGHVVTKGEKKDVVVIAAQNMAYFTCINHVEVDEKDTNRNIPVYVLSDGSEVYGSVTWEMPITLAPESPVNDAITVETADANTVFFNDGEEKLEFDGCEPIVLKLTGCYAGETKIIITNCLDEIVKTVDVTVAPRRSMDAAAIAEIEARIANCNHEYVSEVVPATETAEGYTQHTCHLCGHIYRDAYTEKLPCSHTFTEREIKATCTEQGYTLCTCSKCGYSEKRDMTPLADHTYRDEIVPATCLAQGYTKHTCTICGHTENDTFTPLAAHTYKTEVFAPTCSAQGYTKHTCTVCGDCYMDTHTPMKEHTYLVSTVAATYMEQGYTLHTCYVCGYCFKDNYVPKLACTNHTFAETSRTPAGCTTPGSVTKTCTRCGYVTTEPLPAAGHKYADTITPPSCIAQGYTTHTCTVCGSSYVDTYVPALGHDWEAHTEQRQVGTESHDICGVCGLDFTATGVDLNSHMYAHMKAGEGSRYYTTGVPIYQWVTYNVCKRCGATQ